MGGGVSLEKVLLDMGLCGPGLGRDLRLLTDRPVLRLGHE